MSLPQHKLISIWFAAYYDKSNDSLYITKLVSKEDFCVLISRGEQLEIMKVKCIKKRTFFDQEISHNSNKYSLQSI